MIRYIKNFVLIVASVLLSLCLFFSVVCMVSGMLLTSPGFYKGVAQRAPGYIQEVYEKTQKDIIFKGTLSGLDKSVFENLLTYDVTEALINERIDNVMTGADMPSLKVLTDAMREKAEENFPQVEQQALDDFADFMDNVIAEDTEISFFPDIYPQLDAFFSSASLYLVMILSVAIVGLFFAVWFTAGGNVQNRLRWMLFSVSAAGLMCIFLSVLLFLLNDAAVFNFSTQDLRIYLSEMKICFASVFAVAGIVLVLLVVIYFIAVAVYKKLKRKRPL